MEEAVDVEMPSPKRMRVEAPEQRATRSQSEVFDEFDDIYGTPLKAAEEPSEGIVLPAKVITKSPEHTDQRSPLLPGLGLFQDNLVSSNSAMKAETHKSIHTALQASVPTVVIDEAKDANESLPQEDHTHERPETLETEVLDNVSNLAEQMFPGKESRHNGQDEDKREETRSEVLEDFRSLANKPVSELIEAGRSDQNLGEAMAVDSEENVVSEAGIGRSPRKSTNGPENVASGSEDRATALKIDDQGYSKPEPQGDLDETESLLRTDLPPFEHLATANQTSTEAEFELDSSPLNSSYSDSSDSSSSSEDDAADDYKMLDPAEQARLLMAEEGGSDDEGGGKGKSSGPLRTQNEKPDEDVPKPDVVMTETMKIQELGPVEGMIENLVLIKAKTSGEYQVLEQGSVLCLEDRSVIGAIAETLGRVQQPYYSVRFTNAAAITEAGIAKGTRVFYVEHYSTPVFTQPLKAFKGSDASNLHDEEVGDDELEFSDDEAEAEHKRRVKMQRQAKRAGREGQSDGFSRGPRGGRGGMRGGRGRGRGEHMGANGTGYGLREIQEQAPNPAEAGLDYDDPQDTNMDTEDLYTPLARPINLHEMTGSRPAPTENPNGRWNNDRGGRGRGRGRGDRGGGGGRGRSGFDRANGLQHNIDHHKANGFHQQNSHASSPPNGFTNHPPNQNNGFPPPPSALPQNQNPSNPYAAPNPPHLQAHLQAYPTFQGQSFPQQWTQHHNQQTFQQPQYQQPNHKNGNPYQHTQHQSYPSQSQSQSPFPPTATANPQPTIPPGAHINPAFFRQQNQHQQPQ